MAEYKTHSYDVLVVGAGGAGLRAAIEAAASGVTVGVVTKSLLGKAHTVMAEGGVAAALANVDDRDSWRVHFADTMRGGQYLNNPRMAELHAREAPDRVRELEAWGAVFDRTKDGRILQRNFGGHRYPRLAHVGDRTGLELIRTLQDHVAPATTSNLLFKGAVEGRAQSVYTGLIHIGKEAAGVNAFQTNRNVKLSEGAWAHSDPNLEIENNDVRCSHASAVGPIDPEQRFYLESLGAPPAEAERLIVAGFFEEVIAQLPTSQVGAHVRAAIAEKLDRSSQ